jgi:hypothetical protein
MSPEAKVALCTAPFTRDGLRAIAATLPEDDAELLEWIEEVIRGADSERFVTLLCAAMMAGRKLLASLVAGNRLGLFKEGWRFGWIAAHLEGDVAGALLTTSAETTTPIVAAFAMYVTARWWLQHRPGEPFPSKLQASARTFRHYPGLTPQVESVMGAMAAMMKDPVLARLWGGEGRAAEQNREHNWKEIERMLEGPFEDLIPEKEERGYTGSRPRRRAVEKVGRNEKCRCGSGKKYKHCCEPDDQDRLRRSSAVPGKTWDELQGEIEAVTQEEVLRMSVPELAKTYVAHLPEEAQPLALERLARGEQFDALVDAFQELGVPERLRQTWRCAIQYATRAWKRDVVLRLIAAAGEEATPVEELECSVRFLLASNDPAQFCAAVDAESLALLKSHDSEGLQDLVAGLTWSPYRALGIMVARGALLLTEQKHSSWIFDEILSRRADLDLSIDDPTADLLDERATRRTADEDDAELDEARAKLEAKAAEVRQMREKLAALEREITLREKREQKTAATQAKTATGEAQESAELRDVRAKLETTKSLLKERGEERVGLRREMEKLQADIAALRAKQAASGPAAHEDTDEPPGEALSVHGYQPLRNIELPKKVHETLLSFPPAVGRAVMTLLGRLAAGEPAAFKGLAKIYECDDVVRARVAGDYRLLVRLMPGAVEVLDVVNRRDLQRGARQLRAKGA